MQIHHIFFTIMPRPKDGVWRHFTEIIVDTKPRAKCNKCSEHTVPAVERMNIHLKRCHPTDADGDSEPGPGTSKIPKQQSIAQNVTPKTKQHELNIQITTRRERLKSALNLRLKKRKTFF